MKEPETKECGLEDENAGETLSDRPLVDGKQQYIDAVDDLPTEQAPLFDD